MSLSVSAHDVCHILARSKARTVFPSVLVCLRLSTYTHQSEMSRSPNTPFIPPLPDSPDSSPGPEHPPAIPTGTPNWSLPVANGGGYTPFASPYLAHSPFIPNLSPMITPGEIPGMYSPQQQPKVNRLGFSEDFPGYPPGSGGIPPMFSPNQQPFYSPYSSQSNSLPNSPHYPQSPPESFGTPWNSNVAQLPSTPWGGFSSFGNYGPPPPLTGSPSQMMGGPPPRMGNIPPPQNMPPSQNPPPQHFGQQSFRAPSEPPSQIFDRLGPFTEGKSCASTCFFPMFIAQRRDFD